MFGDMPLPAKFVIAFVVVLALIGIVAWLVRRFGTGNLTTSSGRGRQARLGVIETTAVDSRRRLLLVRRDNVEHLIMLGGPTDLVVEANIVRAQGVTTRDGAAQRPIEPSWPAPADSTLWPGTPEPVARAGRGPALSPSDDLSLQPHPEPAPRVPSSERFPSFAADSPRAGLSGDPQAPRAPEPRTEPRRPLPAAARAAEESHAGDRHLAEMALQLEAALRRTGPPASPRTGASAEPQAARRTEPRFGAEPREPRSRFLDRATQPRSSAAFAPPSRAKPASQPPAPADTGDSPAATSTDAAETTPEPANATAQEPAKEESAAPVETSEPAETQRASLEEEMANLLGRAPGKP